MFKFSTRLVNILAVLTLFYPNNLIAMIDASEEDLRLSKKIFLISGAPYDANDKSKGAMTLCFKRVKGSFGSINYEYEHASLVFEMFFPRYPDDVDVSMVHYGNSGTWGSKDEPMMKSRNSTVCEVYKAYATDLVTGERRSLPAEYIRYASWVLPNDNLIKGYLCARTDITAHENDPALYNSYTAISYAQRIMKKVGLDYVDFEWWRRETSDNLKILVDQCITPKPDYTTYEEICLPTIQ